MSTLFPHGPWPTATPEEVGLDPRKLSEATTWLGGRGCVVRHGRLAFSWGDPTKRGDVASASKPWYTHFLFKALDLGKLPSLDTPAVKYEPRLAELNPELSHKDRDITFAHMATQTSCYGLTERPGQAYAYNDWQMALFVDLLFTKIYDTPLAEVDLRVLHPLLTDPLGCEDQPTMLAFGLNDRAGRVAVSPRDFARFGWLYLHHGRWGDRILLDPDLAKRAITDPLPLSIPRTAGRAAAMLPGQRSHGSKIIPDDHNDHDGGYSWLWWVNGVRRNGERRWPDAPTDVAVCAGHGNGKRGMALFPGLDMVASWNDTRLDGLPEATNPLGRWLAALTASVLD
ncbi:MAG: hypothetical protein IT442_12815 [Phycisphaeraceae bacterium]|nr:hypothetical protein [Phycisphaeraceae bacterium]